MPPLASNLRKDLDKAVQHARDIGEAAARAALARLGVPEPRAPDFLSPEQRELRNRLRAHARQLGDTLYADKRQDTERLVTEIAYQHWHRMLFTRFLAENRLLMHPTLGAPVTLAECAELAEEEGAKDGWTLAGRYAARMLPQIFRPDEPALALAFAPEHQRALEQLLEALPAETFTASDALGWVYQFWQSKKKDEVNRSGVKIGADELPAVTQLFTEHYMVLFLLHNTLGAWWTGRHPDAKPPVELEYLRRLDDGTPAAGTFDGWPATARELRVMDPCCGSGHFLVAAFDMLVPMRMREEGLSAREACERVIADNLFGLEIDERCTQIAAFALALAAWTYPGAGGYRPLPEMNIACSGLAVGAKREEWVALGNGDERLRQGMDRLYSLFKDAPVLGSLIDPKRSSGGDLFAAEFSELQPLLQKALEREKGEGDYAGEEIGIAAQGIAKAAELLSRKYDLLCTNVPYLGRGNQSAALQSHADRSAPDATADLATMFLSRIISWTAKDKSVAVVSPQNWWFAPSYRPFRKRLLSSMQWCLVAALGEEAWQAFGNRGPFATLSILIHAEPSRESRFWGIDLTSKPGEPTVEYSEKAVALRGRHPQAALRFPLILLSQAAQKSRPSSVVAIAPSSVGTRLSEHVESAEGSSTGDNDRFVRYHWEVLWGRDWVGFAGSNPNGTPWGGKDRLLFWQAGIGPLATNAGARIQGTELWNAHGVIVGRVRQITSSLYRAAAFDKSTVAIRPQRLQDLPAVFAFTSSPAYEKLVRQLDTRVAASTGAVTAIPFDLAHWTRVAEEQYPNGLPEPYSNDPTQWLFKGEVTDTAEPLQVAVARLLGYRWPDQEPDALADDDGIVCLPAVGGELPAADRLQALLIRAYGDAWSGGRVRQMLEGAGANKKNLADWLRDDFFKHHCKTFNNRPFIWHIWDGRKDGFSALVNYHRLDRGGMEKLTYTYLGDWTERQRADAAEDVPGADVRLAAARELKTELEAILAGEPPYDIFVRWKPLHEQPLGWEPDLNDGVRLNVRPFVEAGVLRAKFNVHWRNDRGKNPPGDSWGEDRINDRHLSRAEKQAARRDVPTAGSA